jgi:hypothetical protein
MPVDISSALGKMTRPIQNIGQMSTFSQFIGRRARPLYVKSSAIYTPPQLARTNRRKIGINVETATVEQLATRSSSLLVAAASTPCGRDSSAWAWQCSTMAWTSMSLMRSVVILLATLPHVHSNNTRPPASVRISVMRANFPYCLQCRSASSCTALALVANHLSTRPLALPFAGGGAAAQAESASAVANIMTGLKFMTICPWLCREDVVQREIKGCPSARFCQRSASFEMWTACGQIPAAHEDVCFTAPICNEHYLQSSPCSLRVEGRARVSDLNMLRLPCAHH